MTTLSVLVYVEGAQVCARAVDLDLLGQGDTEAEALAALEGIVLAQYAVALRRSDPSLIRSPGPKDAHDRYLAARRGKPIHSSDRAVEIPAPRDEAVAEYAAELRKAAVRGAAEAVFTKHAGAFKKLAE
jgi:hypothetical protein